MIRTFLTRFVASAFRQTRAWKPHLSPGRFAPLGEELEDRWVPDTYRWAPLLNNNWSTTYVLDGLTNWSRVVGGVEIPATKVPGADDTVVFTGSTSNSSCIVDKDITVSSISINSKYAGRLILQKSLTVTDRGNMDTGVVTGFPDVVGNGAGRGTLTVAAGALFTWGGGTLNNIDVNVLREDNKVATFEVHDGQTRSLGMYSTTLNVHGSLVWNSGTVAVFPNL